MYQLLPFFQRPVLSFHTNFHRKWCSHVIIAHYLRCCSCQKPQRSPLAAVNLDRFPPLLRDGFSAQLLGCGEREQDHQEPTGRATARVVRLRLGRLHLPGSAKRGDDRRQARRPSHHQVITWPFFCLFSALLSLRVAITLRRLLLFLIARAPSLLVFLI